MTKTKLTLSVDPRIVARAKRFSEKHDTTVSRLVSEFLEGLEDEERAATPIAIRLRGVLPVDVKREEHRTHLELKHG
jgi:Family of unknown function (DUF6364)